MSCSHSEDKETIYNECKYKVKLWEHEFRKKHKRLPSKLDIREADNQVRNAYKIYYRLKTAALEESLMNLDGFDIGDSPRSNLVINKESLEVPSEIDAASNKEIEGNLKKVWGVHLNKAIDLDVNNTNRLDNANVNISFTQKLFKRSQNCKKLPRKSLSFVRKKSEVDDKNLKGLSKSEFATSSSFNCEEESEIDNVELNISEIKNNLSQPVNSQPTLFRSNTTSDKPIRNLDQGWLERLTQSTGIDLLSEDLNSSQTFNNTEYDSDDIIANSEDELENSSVSYPISKRMKFDELALISNNKTNVLPQPATECSKLKLIDSNQKAKLELIAVDEKTKRLDFSNIFTKNFPKKSDENNVKLVKSTSNKKEIAVSKLKRACKVANYAFEISDPENEDPFHSDNDDKDPEFILTQSESSNANIKETSNTQSKVTAKVVNKSAKRNLKGNEVKEPTTETDPASQVYELEYSLKPRTVTVPRVKNIKKVIYTKNKEVEPSSCKLEFNQEEIKMNHIKKKINSGTLNDNYVLTNLKKKVFVRGKSNRTFTKYKKKQWKDKKKALYGPDMDMGGCDGGMLTCFNCNQVGHFARQCTANKSDVLLPRTDVDKEEEYLHPTLEEASKMAEGSALCIRKPNQVQLNKNDKIVSEMHLTTGDSVACGDFLTDEFEDELVAETKRLEKEICNVNFHKYIDIAPSVKPYYESKEDGSLIDCPPEVYEALNKFGYETFRTGQLEAIMRILSGKSTLVTLSTGSGKSLCYQLPAYLYSKREPCITLIISPLVSLMEDQITGIPEFLTAACLHTYQTKTQKDKIMKIIDAGTLDILLVSPEAVVAGEKSSGFGSLLRKLPPIAFACIDEAHCVSQWSHNFRPSYLKICKVLKDRLGVQTILGLTATATKVTSDSIVKHFGMLDGDEGIIRDIPLPDNLKLTISRDIRRDPALLSLLLSERFEDCQSIIVYCTRREECERVAKFLRTSLKSHNNVPVTKKRKRAQLLVEPYHAGLSASLRRSVQKAFMTGKLRIVVATVAFSMGINKSDLRAVIHYNMPMSFESYVQEVGRAGRDGLPAHCHLFLDPEGRDESELLRHVYANSIDRHALRKLLQKCFIPCSCKTLCPRHEVAFSIKDTVQALDVPEENIETLLCYLELHTNHVEILSHVYISCKIISYNGPNEIKKAAKECVPLAMALAMNQSKSNLENVFEFPVVEIASAIGWDSGICKHLLKNLEWTNENNKPCRSKLTVQFSNLGFHLLSSGNLSDLELDETLDRLYERVQEQEITSKHQLHAICSTLTSVTKASYKQCLSNDDFNENEHTLKNKIREYFSSSKFLELLPEQPKQTINEDQIVRDIRSLICMYRDNTFTGRAIARIFHGIQSPNYPAIIWGRCKFWRVHLGSNFNAVCDVATKEILSMR